MARLARRWLTVKGPRYATYAADMRTSPATLLTMYSKSWTVSFQRTFSSARPLMSWRGKPGTVVTQPEVASSDHDFSHPPDLVCSDESRSTQLELVVQLFLIGQAVLILGLQSSDTALHHCELLLGLVQDLLRGFQVLLGFPECSLQGWWCRI